MKIFTVKLLLTILLSSLLTGCSVFGDNNVESAPYTLITSDNNENIEIRNYDSMILVSTSMSDDSGNSAFRKLFKYITGENQGATEIAMTAPVIMDDDKASKQGTEIAMTAPVFMNENADTPMMSFVMPKEFTLETTPKPTNPEVIVSEVNDYKVAAIQFSWTLSDSNAAEHTEILENWLVENGYTISGKAVKAGYNGPLTLPWFRRNEVLIEIR